MNSFVKNSRLLKFRTYQITINLVNLICLIIRILLKLNNQINTILQGRFRVLNRPNRFPQLNRKPKPKIGLNLLLNSVLNNNKIKLHKNLNNRILSMKLIYQVFDLKKTKTKS